MEKTPVNVRITLVWLISAIFLVVYEHLPRRIYLLLFRTLPALPNLPIKATRNPCKFKKML